ncbi:MAG: hypothetical protein NE327_10040 [Lentisphaeraceae bacterium]|nr:hypothetical protein [Lentisphaeraceae bacterium]
MDETTEMYIDKVSNKNKSRSQKLIILTLLILCVILTACLVVLQIHENNVLADRIQKAKQAQMKTVELLNTFNDIPNSDTVESPESLKAFKAFENAEKDFKEKRFPEASEAYEKAGQHFSQAAEALQIYNSLRSELNQVESALPLLESLGTYFPEFLEKASDPIIQKCVEVENLIEKFDLENAQTSLNLLKGEFTALQTSLKQKNTELEEQWTITKKEHNKQSYQVFISSFPHSKYIKDAEVEIAKLINAENLLKEKLALEEKKKEEELKKEQEIIAARKAKQEAELKQKMQLEQVVTLNFDDGSSYTGQLNQEKKPHGDGAFSYTNSNVYRGNWKDGLYHGQGSYEFYTGVSFKGEWLEGKRHGKGLLTWKNGDSLLGVWSNGQLQGKAIFTPKQGIKMTLNFHNGEEIGNMNPEAFMKQKEIMEDRYKKDRLSKKEKKAYEFFKRFNEALDTMKTENPDILFPDTPVYIPRNKSYASGHMNSRDAEKHERLLKEIFFEQKRYLMVTKKSLNKDEVGETESAEFGGYTIMTASLGVILDNSGSMTQHLPKLRKKIEDKFKKSAFIEVTGCSLSETDGEKIDLETAKLSTVAAIKYLVNEKGVDTIYWFSDLNDPQSEKALEELKFFFYKNLITFYISSVDLKPSDELKDLIEETGGKVLRF